MTKEPASVESMTCCSTGDEALPDPMFSETWIKLKNVCFKKMHLKVTHSPMLLTNTDLENVERNTGLMFQFIPCVTS